MHMKQLKMLFQVIQISSLNKGVLNQCHLVSVMYLKWLDFQ